jgi:small subunit ribosomal protein S20
MANIKSQKKRILTNERRRLRNKAVRSELKTRVKAAQTEIAAGSDDAPTSVWIAQKRLAKASAKGVLHKNQAARRTSRLMRKAAAAAAASES